MNQYLYIILRFLKKANKTKVGVILSIDSTTNEQRKSKVARRNNTNIDLTCIINKNGVWSVHQLSYKHTMHRQSLVLQQNLFL
jgi:hypothetical protein